MSNSWIIPVGGSIAGLGLLYLGYSMYNNKQSTAAYNAQEAYLDNDDRESRVGGKKSKRRKYKKNASKKRR